MDQAVRHFKMGKKHIIAQAVQALHTKSSFNNKWIETEVLIAVLKKFLLLPFDVSTSVFNNSMSQMFTGIDSKQNYNCIVSRRYNREKGKPTTYGYYLKSNTTMIASDLNWIKKCYYDINSLIDDCIAPPTRSSSILVSSSPTLHQATPQSISPSPAKRKHEDTTNSATSIASKLKCEKGNNPINLTPLYILTNRSANRTTTTTTTTSTSSNTAAATRTISKWDSPEAFKFFLGKERFDAKKQETAGDKHPHESFCLTSHIETQILRLRAAYLHFNSWRYLIDDQDNQNLFSQYDIFVIQTKAKYLSVFLSLCLKYYSISTATDISKDAIKKVQQIDCLCNDEFDSFDPTADHYMYTKYVINHLSLLDWFHDFKNNNDCFCNKYATKTRACPMPTLLQNNPDILEAIT